MTCKRETPFSLLKTVVLIGIPVGVLLALFSAPYWILGIVLLLGVYLAIAGTGALFLVNLGLTGLFFAMAVRRPWPEAWYDYIHPITQARPWASVLLAIWVGAIMLSGFLGMEAQELCLAKVSPRYRITRFVFSWLSGLGIGGLAVSVWLRMTSLL